MFFDQHRRPSFLIPVFWLAICVGTQLHAAPQDATLPSTEVTEAERQLESAIKTEPEKALELARELFDEHRNALAARYLLQQLYLGKQWKVLTEPERNEFGALLKSLRTAEPDSLAIKVLFTDYLIASNNLNDALPLLLELAEVQPMRGLQAAAIERKRGNVKEAKALSKACLETVRAMSEDAPENAVLALAVAQNQLFLGRFEPAVETLNNAAERVQGNEDQARINQAMGDAIVAWINHIETRLRNDDNDRKTILRMLERAMKFAPNNPRVLTVLADQVLSTSNDDPETKELREKLLSAATPGISHFIRGTEALMRDDVQGAEKHLKVAADLMPRSGAILNNLAVAMTTRPDADFESALKIANTAIEQTPNATPHFFETRGQILYQLKRYQEAIKDLAKATTVPSIAAGAHKSLAGCYEGLGEKEKASLHRKLAANAFKANGTQE